MQIPSFVQQEIFPLSTEQESALAAEGVIRLTCGDYQFTTKVCSYLLVTSHWCTTEVFSTYIDIYRRLQELVVARVSLLALYSSGPRAWFNSQ